MKLATEQLLGTLEVLNESLKRYENGETYCSGYKTFYWNTSVKGNFSFWKLMQQFSYIKNITPEQAIELWQKEEQTHSIAPRDDYSLDELDRNLLLDEATKNIRVEKYQKLLHLLKLNSLSLEAFAINLNSTSYNEGDFNLESSFTILIAQITKECWLCLTTSVPQRHSFPHSIIGDSLELNKSINSQESKILQLQSDLNNILQQLPALKLAICGVGGYGYTYNYQLFSSFATTKELAIAKALNSARVLEIKQFQSFLSTGSYSNYQHDYRDRNYYSRQNISKFLQQKLTDINVYRIGFYDSDYVYLMGETSNNDLLGLSFSRGYIYNP